MSVMHKITLGLLLVAVTATGARAISGTATLTGHTSISVNPCGNASRAFTASFQLLDDGTWSEQGNVTMSGTYTAVGTKGRKFRLTLDDASRTTFLGIAQTEVSQVCRIGVTITGSKQKPSAVVLNRKGTQVTVTLKYGVSGRAGGRSGHAVAQIRAKGAWTPTTPG